MRILTNKKIYNIINRIFTIFKHHIKINKLLNFTKW